MTLIQTEMILSLFAACEALKAATEMRCRAQNEEAPSCAHNFQGMPCKQNDRRITKGSVTSTPQADAPRSDTVTVSHIRYFTAAVTAQSILSGRTQEAVASSHMRYDAFATKVN